MVSSLLPNGSQAPPRPIKNLTVPESEIPLKGVHADDGVGNMQMTSHGKPGIMFPVKDGLPVYSEARDSTAGPIKSNNFDLNDIYIDSDDGMEDLERSPVPENLVTGSLECPSWVQQDSHQSSPPQTSGNSDSASAQSPSSSSGEAQVYVSGSFSIICCFESVALHNLTRLVDFPLISKIFAEVSR